jgi:hypothetical protein
MEVFILFIVHYSFKRAYISIDMKILRIFKPICLLWISIYTFCKMACPNSQLVRANLIRN